MYDPELEALHGYYILPIMAIIWVHGVFSSSNRSLRILPPLDSADPRRSCGTIVKIVRWTTALLTQTHNKGERMWLGRPVSSLVEGSGRVQKGVQTTCRHLPRTSIYGFIVLSFSLPSKEETPTMIAWSCLMSSRRFHWPSTSSPRAHAFRQDWCVNEGWCVNWGVGMA